MKGMRSLQHALIDRAIDKLELKPGDIVVCDGDKIRPKDFEYLAVTARAQYGNLVIFCRHGIESIHTFTEQAHASLLANKFNIPPERIMQLFQQLRREASASEDRGNQGREEASPRAGAVSVRGDEPVRNPQEVPLLPAAGQQNSVPPGQGKQLSGSLQPNFRLRVARGIEVYAAQYGVNSGDLPGMCFVQHDPEFEVVPHVHLFSDGKPELRIVDDGDWVVTFIVDGSVAVYHSTAQFKQGFEPIEENRGSTKD